MYKLARYKNNNQKKERFGEPWFSEKIEMDIIHN
jgi:hypothetical protein